MKQLLVYKSDHNNQAKILDRWVQPFDKHVFHGSFHKGDQVLDVKNSKPILKELRWMLLKYAEATGIKNREHWHVLTSNDNIPNYQMFALFVQDYCAYANCVYRGHVPEFFFEGTAASLQKALKSGVSADFYKHSKTKRPRAITFQIIHVAFAAARALLQCHGYTS